MAVPTYVEMIVRWTNRDRIVDTLWKAYSQNATNFVGTEATFVQDNSLNGDYVGEEIAAHNRSRAQLSAALASQKACYDQMLLDMAGAISSNETDPRMIIDDLYDYMIANSKTIVQRNITRGSVSAGGSNVGNGTVYPLVVDDQGLAIEDFWGYDGASVVTRMECVSDSHSGQQSGSERFRVWTPAIGPIDNLHDSSGVNEELVVNAIAAESSGLLANANFATYRSGGTPPFAAWFNSSATYTGITQDTTSALSYRPLRGTISHANQSGKFSSVALTSAAGALYQYLQRQVDYRQPYFFAVRFDSDATADGNVKITVGGVNNSVAVSAETSQLLILNSSTAKNAWPENFATTSTVPIKVQIERTSATTGTVYISDVYAVPYSYFLGRWFVILSGSTDFQRDDYFTFTDTTPGTLQGTRQYWLNRFYPGKYLPHAASMSATEADYT